MTERKTVVYPNPEVLAQAVAARTLLTIADLLAEPNRQRVDIAVTGGTDGIYVLKVMGESPLAEAVDWSRVHVWWGDERFVAADSDDRNAKQAREAWFGKLIEDGRMPAENIHEMPADGRSDDEITTATPEQTDAVLAAAAAEYQRELIEQLGDKPSLDIAMFGVGPDAHFASLFPDHGEAEINDPHVLVVGVRDFAETAATTRDTDCADDRPFEAHVGVHFRGAQSRCGTGRLRSAQQSACAELLRRW